MTLEELRRAIRCFVPLGGLSDWKVKIEMHVEPVSFGANRCANLSVAANVPNAETPWTPIRIPIEFTIRRTVFEIEQYQMTPADFIFDYLITELVLHEAKESIGFRRRPERPTVWVDGPSSCSEPVDHTIDRPFEPHKAAA